MVRGASEAKSGTEGQAPMTIAHTNGELRNDGIPKPKVLAPNWDGMPDELKSKTIWLVWKLEYNPNMTKPWTKVPYAEKGGGVRRLDYRPQDVEEL